MKKFFPILYSQSISLTFGNYFKYYYRYMISCLLLLLSGILLLNLAIGQTGNGIENNLQQMPSITVDLGGKANTSYEIEIPSGTNGMQPNLSIHYSSTGAPGVFGMGWNLSGVDWISRDAVYGIDFSANDKYVSSMVGGLVKNGSVYYSKKESFMKFVATGSPPFTDTDKWTATDKNGTIYSYSYAIKTPEVSIPAVWALAEVRDIYNNNYTIDYSSDRITLKYADRQIAINFKDKLNKVKLYSKSSPYPDNKIVDTIIITAGGSFSRTYSFGYTTDINNNEVLETIHKEENVNGQNTTYYTPITYSYSSTTKPDFTSGGEFSNPSTYAIGYIPLSDKRECLVGASYCFSAGVACPTAPPALKASCELKKKADQLQCNAYTLTWLNPCTVGIKSPMPMNTLLDIDGDGKQEIVHLNGSERTNDIHLEVTKKDPANNSFIRSRISNNFPGFQYKTFSTLGFGDINGDGKPDFAYSDGAVLQVAFSNGSTFNDPVAYNNVNAIYGRDDYFQNYPDFNWKGTLVDMNGDGRADYVRFVDPTHIGIYLWTGSSFADMVSVDVGPVFREQGDGPETGQFMDMNGDGRPELVFVTASHIQTRRFAKDFSSSIPADYEVANTGTPLNRWFTDINSDGRTDFVILNPTGTLTPYFYNGIIYTKGSEISVPVYSEYSTKTAPYRKFFADVNGDGYVDYIRYGSDNLIHASYGNGNGFNGGDASGNNGFTLSAKSLWNMGDVDGDGRPDFISMKEMDANRIMEAQFQAVSVASDAMSYRADEAMKSYVPTINLNGRLSIPNASNFVKTNLGINKVPNLTPAAMLSALLVLMNNPDPPINMESKVEVYFQNPRTKENSLIKIDGGYGRTIDIVYRNYKDFREAVLDSSGDYPNLRNINIGELVYKVTSNYANLSVNTDTYSYTNNRMWLGFPEDSVGLGFRTRSVHRSLSGETHLERYMQSSPILAGISDYNETKNAIGQYRQITNLKYSTKYPLGQEWTSLDSTDTTQYQDGIILLTTKESFLYDSYGNVLTKTTSAANYEIKEESRYTYDTGRWLLTRPNLTAKAIDGVVVENAVYSYSGDTDITMTAMSGTVAAATSTITLDSFGNQKSIQDPLGRITSYEYDPTVHNFVTRITNPKGFIVTKTYDTNLGLELTTTDANGAVMTKHYDGKGRLQDIVPPGESSYVERYSYTDYTPSGSVPYFTSVTKSVVNPDRTETTASEYFDILGRSIRKESPGIQGKFIVETTEYDGKGQVIRQSSPYLDTLENPVYTNYTYHPYEGYMTQIIHPDGGYTNLSYNGFNESTQSYASDGTLIQSQDIIKNAKGQVKTRTVDGKSLNYQYDTAGKIVVVQDPENMPTLTQYDNAGRKISVTDVNSGTTGYTYDEVGNIKTQTDARGITTTFTYDTLNRPTSITYSNGEGNTVLTYDEGGIAQYANGRLTTVTDAAGTLRLGYDIKGNRIYQKRTIEDLNIIFRREYDIQNRLSSITYPDGTRVYQKYASTGHFSAVTMDTANGASRGYTVGSYTGPVIENGVFKIIRETGNGVKQEIEYDPIKRRPKGLVMRLRDGNIASAISYTYDQKNNITKIADNLVSARTQEFAYDTQNRLTQAVGKYGFEVYRYSEGGNLTQRGQYTLIYGDTNHRHAVTQVTSPATGIIDYVYDDTGNMISRNGDSMVYNSQGKLKQIDTAGGDKIEYLYDSTGNRIKRKMKNSGVSVYSFDTFDGLSAGGLYEIQRTPGQPESHTLYIKGLYGDIFSQITRTDAVLISHRGTETQREGVSGEFFSRFNVCAEVSGSCFDYYRNSAKYYLLSGTVEGLIAVNRIEYRVGAWGLLVVILFILSQILTKLSLYGSIQRSEDQAQTPLRLYVSVANPLLIVAVLFTFTQCGIASGSTQGEPPWALFASGINSNTPSVDDSQNTTTTTTSPTTTTPSTEANPTNPQSGTGTIGNTGFTQATTNTANTGNTQTTVTNGNPNNTVPPRPTGSNNTGITTSTGTTTNTGNMTSTGTATSTGGQLTLSDLLNLFPTAPTAGSGSSGNTGTSTGTGTTTNPVTPSVTLPAVPVRGMFFLHPDHLGSITTITDGTGNVITGGSGGGKSHISYKPYGEIHRTDSSGPDVSRFKYTGQEEDKESGLLYYKARYYDPVLGRFLSADSMAFPERVMGMNRYMYVEGNPVNYRDPSGHRKIGAQEGALIGYVLASQAGSPIPKEYGYYLGAYMAANQGGHNGKSAIEDMAGGARWASGGLARAGDAYNAYTGRRKYQGKNDIRRSDIGGIHGGKAWDSIIGKDGINGWISRATGWKRISKWWDYQVKDKEFDYMRETIGGLIVDKICEDDPRSENCRNAAIARGIDRNAQSKKYYNKTKIKYSALVGDDGIGYRAECYADSQGQQKCILVKEDSDFDPEIFIVPGPNS